MAVKVIDVLMEPAALPEANALLLALESGGGRRDAVCRDCAAISLRRGNMPFARVVAREDGSVIFASSHLEPGTTDASGFAGARYDSSGVYARLFQLGMECARFIANFAAAAMAGKFLSGR